MKNTDLIIISLRLSGLFLFMKIFDNFSAYLMSVYFTAVIPSLEKFLDTPIEKFYYTGFILIILNIIVSYFLIFKAEWITKKLIKREIQFKINLNSLELIKISFLFVGIIWISSSLLMFYDFIQYLNLKFNITDIDSTTKLGKFNIFNFILQITFGLILIIKNSKISNFFNNRIINQ